MILVTGAAGKTGLAVLKALADRKQAARALIRRSEQDAVVKEAGAAEALVADLGDAPALETAMRGIEAAYLICPNMQPREFEMGQAAIQAAQAAGLPRLVYHSVLYPQIEAMPHHWNKLRVEEALIASGLDFSILQPASYMQNILGYWEGITTQGRFALPYSPEAASTPVDLEDVAAVAASVLTEDGHRGAIYPLAGPERLSSLEMAAQIGAALGREIQVEQMPLAEWQAAARANGLDEYAVDTLSKMFVYYDRHGFSGNSRTLEDLLGRAPTRFADFLARQTN